MCLSVSLALAAEWQEGAGVVTVANITPEEARKQALDLARKDALEKARLEVVGITSRQIVESSETGIYDHFIQFTRTITRGRIVEEQILFDNTEQQAIPGTARSQLVYRIALRANIEPDKGEADPVFQVAMTLNRQSFRDGDTVSIELSATKDCFATVFNLYSNDSLRVVFPNKYMSDNSLKANSTLRIPPSAQAGWSLPVSLLPQKSSDAEALLVIATKAAIPFPTMRSESREGLLSVGDALLAINNWLINIPAEQRTQDMATYRVVK
jgi:hypothetical protein